MNEEQDRDAATVKRLRALDAPEAQAAADQIEEGRSREGALMQLVQDLDLRLTLAEDTILVDRIRDKPRRVVGS